MAEELPNEPIFTQLLHVARTVSHVVVHDSQKGVNADYPQLLTDLLRMRALLRDSLPASLFEDNHALLNEDSPYVFLLANGNYDFIIGAFAILSIGGAVVPLRESTLRTSVDE
jgi:malonyl-CoA/methylmalonyl-CoA synthetase